MPAALVGYVVVLTVRFIKSTVVTWSDRGPRLVSSVVIVVVATAVVVVAAAPATGVAVLARAASIVVLSCEGLVAVSIGLRGVVSYRSSIGLRCYLESTEEIHNVLISSGRTTNQFFA